MSFDVGIIGCGIAGTFAALKIADKFKKCSVTVYELGRRPLKRRRQLEGFLGCFPTGNTRLYPNNLNDIRALTDGRKVMPVYRWLLKYLNKVDSMNLISDNKPNAAILDLFQKNNFDVTYNDYFQWKPINVHNLSKLISKKLYSTKNIKFNFDTEVIDVNKNSNTFTIVSSNGNVECKRILLCVGRSGWRWVTNLYKKFDIINNDNYATYGVRIEVPSNSLANMNQSHCTISGNDMVIGPFNWSGTIIPEDHSDLVISAFRSNEDRWYSEKVSFSLLTSVEYCNSGCMQIDRIGKLTFLLFNDRIGKEKISTYMKGNSVLNLLPEYSWLHYKLNEVNKVIPGIINRGYIHIPHISPLPAKIKISNNMESELNGMYVAGECARIPGIIGAAVSGAMAANSICR